MKTHKQTDKIEGSLNAMVKDCALQLKPIAKMRFKHMSDSTYAFEISFKTGKPVWIDGGYSITVHPWAAGQLFNYVVERAVILKGDRDTPDDVDIQLVQSYRSLNEAFTRIIVEWFKEGVETALQNAAEARLYAEEAQRIVEETAHEDEPRAFDVSSLGH